MTRTIQTQQLRLNLQKFLLDILEEWKRESIIDNFEGDHVNVNSADMSITICVTVIWDKSDFDAQIKVRRAMFVLAARAAEEAKTDLRSTDLVGGQITVNLGPD